MSSLKLLIKFAYILTCSEKITVEPREVAIDTLPFNDFLSSVDCVSMALGCESGLLDSVIKRIG